MANRSYLYSFSEDKEGNMVKIFDISEQNYEIPIIYKILVSENTQIIPSKVFDNAFALKGDAKEGRKKLNTFFKKLYKADIFDKAELSGLEEDLQRHLDKFTLDYFLFEPTEVLAMDDVNFEKEVKNIAKEIASYNKMISNYIKEAEGDYWDDLGIDISSLLYYSMGNQDEVKQIDAQFSNKKLAEAKRLIAKKPTIKRYAKLINELNPKTDQEEIERALDTILTLNPTNEDLWNCAHHYDNLDKKLALFKQIATDYPNEEKTKEVNYWLSDIYEEKKQYDLALKHLTQFIVDRNDPNYDPYLKPIIEGGNFNKEEIYRDLAQKTKNYHVERELIKIEIDKQNPEVALQKFYALDEAAQLEFMYLVMWDFLNANQLDSAFELINKFEAFVVAMNYYKNKGNLQKALYYAIKDGEYISRFIQENLPKNKAKLTELFEEIYPVITDFKPKYVLETAKEFDDNPTIVKKLLEALIPTCKNEGFLSKAYLLLSKIYKKEGNLEQAKTNKELAIKYDPKIKYKDQYKKHFKEKKYQKAAESYLKYIQNSDQEIRKYAKVAEKFFDKELYQEAIKIYTFFLSTKDEEYYEKTRDYNMVGLCYLRLKKQDTTNAYNYFKKAFECDNEEVVVHKNLFFCASSKYEANELEQAKEMFHFCLDNFEHEVAKTYTYLGVIYDKFNQDDKALEYFEKALALEPKNEVYQKNVQYIKSKNKGF